MSVNADTPQAEPIGRTIKGYTEDSHEPRQRLRRILIVTATLAFCIVYGMAFAFIAPYLLLAFAVPIVVLAGMAIWALPDGRNAPVVFMQNMFFAYIVATVMWPNYLGIALPGLPWFTVARFTAFPVVISFLLCYSTSSPFRARLRASLSGVPAIWKFVVAFALVQIFSIFLSKDKGLSINHFVNSLIYWVTMFYVAAYVFMQPGMLHRFLKLMWGLGVAVGFICLWEVHLRHVPWRDHIPEFLQIQDPVVKNYIAGQGRNGTDIYRAEGTFLHPLALGEYIALVMPFVLQYAIGQGKPALRIAAAASVIFLMYIAILSGSRSGIIGCVAALGLFLLLWGATRWRTRSDDVIGPAVVLSYPLGAAMFMVATRVVGKLRNKIWGGGEAASSTEGRLMQWRKAIPIIEHNPIGHGVGMAAATLDYQTPSGFITIDSYYLSVALEYGLHGVVVYYGMFFYAIYKSVSISFSRLNLVIKDSELLMLAPLGMMIVNFIILKSVYSEEYNHCFAYMGLGAICALVYRIKQKTQEIQPAAQPVGVSHKAARSAARSIVGRRPRQA